MKPVSRKRMSRLLEARGWQLDRVKGSHHVYYHPGTGRSVIVPVHGNADLKPGTQHRIMRDAGITAADL
jgi:predicted RNA binding protein YcfA (HicA-like mRNA interferase family)